MASRKVAQKAMKVIKVKTGENKSDALTKYLAKQEIQKHMDMTGQRFTDL